jgi:hypothetical protein
LQQVRKYEERVWKEENQRGKHIPGYGGFIPQEEDSPASDIMLPRFHVPDMEVWGGKQSGYCGHKPEVINQQTLHPSLRSNLQHRE